MDTSSSITSRLRYWLFLILIYGCCFLILFAFKSSKLFSFKSISDYLQKNSVYNHQRHPDDSYDNFTIQTQGCTIPFLNYINSEIEEFVFFPKDFEKCSKNVSLLQRNKFTISIIKENAQQYGVKDVSMLYCCYRPFYRPKRIENIYSKKVDGRVMYKSCIHINDTAVIQDEFIRVTCMYKNRILYEQFYLFAQEKTLLLNDALPQKFNETAYNVLILGIDGVSRLNLYRTMPKTVSYIMKNGAIDLTGYNKVGDNSFPNLVPLLMGVKDSELKHTCWPYSRSRFDNCPFIWHRFKEIGYYTAFGEDSSKIGTFNYFLRGFATSPTDYYLHTFINEVEAYIDPTKDIKCYLCHNDNYIYKIVLDYIADLTVTLKKNKFFGFFWETCISHDFLNHPMVMDDDYLNFFMKLNATNYLRNTIIIFLSDHGIRWGPIQKIKQGWYEQRLPFLFLVVPLTFRENYPKAYNNLKLNAKRLTTPFDVHASLVDLIDLNGIEDHVIHKRTEESYSQRRGISLFLPIPTNRTCKMAGIEDHWCTCYREVALPKDSLESQTVALQLVTHLNDILRDHPKCSRLTLSEVIDIKEIIINNKNTSYSKYDWREFTVKVQTLPGYGIFEGTLSKDEHKWSLSGTVSRLNRYGTQSRCVYNYQLKLYCFCL